jgi:hypothetical protein
VANALREAGLVGKNCVTVSEVAREALPMRDEKIGTAEQR